MHMRFFRIIFLAAMLLAGVSAVADEAVLKPFMSGAAVAGDQAKAAEAAKAALTANGFEVAGSYSPYAGTTVLAVTSPEIKANAAKSDLGGFGAALRVSVVQAKDNVQVAYTNPEYWANAYRMADDLKPLGARFEAALGKGEAFGAKGLTAKQLRKYHYMMGMEYFDEPSLLAEHASHAEALAAVEANLSAGKAGVTKVYRVEVPGKEAVLFGVGMKGPKPEDKNMDDAYIMSEIDFKDVKSAAHLPYEMLVDGKKVYALYARFRIAASFPDLSMMGSNSFMNIMGAPEAIRKALVQAAGGKLD